MLRLYHARRPDIPVRPLLLKTQLLWLAAAVGANHCSVTFVSCGWHYRNGILQAEADESFWTQFHFLPLGNAVCASTRPGSRRRSDGSPFAATKDSTQARAYI